ncbi:MAG: hypothetical protein ACFFHD_05185 [Promethearchaeota archaeon]
MNRKEYLYHELKRVSDNRVEGKSKSLDTYIQLYTKIVREVSENLKSKYPFKIDHMNNTSKEKLISALNEIQKLEK